MLVATVELWPYGLDDRAKFLAEAMISNEGTYADGDTYRAEITEVGDLRLGIQPLHRVVHVRGYHRQQSVWNLVRKALEGLEEQAQQLPFDVLSGSSCDEEHEKATEDLSRGETLESEFHFRRELAEEAGGLLNTRELRRVLQDPSFADLLMALQHRRLLAVLDGDTLLFPECQVRDGTIMAGIQPVLCAAPNIDAWRMLQYLVLPERGLAGRRAIDLIQGSTDDLAEAVRIARTLEI